MTSRRYGHVPPPTLHRGTREAPSPLFSERMPARVSLLDLRPPTLDQGPFGSCVEHVVCGAATVLGHRLGECHADSPLGLYFAVRRYLGVPLATDPGSTLADALQVASTVGFYPADLWPEDPTWFNPHAGAPGDFEAVAARRRAVHWTPLAHDRDTLRWTLYSGYPVLAGLRVFDTFEDDHAWSTGEVRMPVLHAGNPYRGGHAVLVLGYDDAHDVFFFQNSYGAAYGAQSPLGPGVGTLPAAYLLSPTLCTELQVLRAVHTYPHASGRP